MKTCQLAQFAQFSILEKRGLHVNLWKYRLRKIKIEWTSNQSRKYGKGVETGLFPSDSLEYQSYDFDKIAHMKPLYGVKRLHRSSFESYGQFLKKLNKTGTCKVGATSKAQKAQIWNMRRTFSWKTPAFGPPHPPYKNAKCSDITSKDRI